MQFPISLTTVVLGSINIDLFVPDEKSIREVYERGEIDFPFWSQVWPASKALAQFLLSQPAFTKNKVVLEIGAGLGLPSLVAARNASSVLCTDHARDAVAVISQSAKHHRLKNFRAYVVDWNHLPENLGAEVLLLSDINYEAPALAVIEALVHRFLSSDATVILSTPERLMAKGFISSLLKHCAVHVQIVVPHAGQQVPVSILVLQP